MKVFISWSGDKSRAVGELLEEWLQCVLQAVEPWMSSLGLDRGSLWYPEINDQLKDASIGIICLTNSNKEKPWILFEAGALAKGLSTARVCTFLIDLEYKDIKDPLAQFNATLPTKDDVKKLVITLNKYLGDKALKLKTLEQVFETYWPQFEEKFNKILGEHEEEKSTVDSRTDEDLLTEILAITRGLEKRVRNMEGERETRFRALEQVRESIHPNSAKRLIEELLTHQVSKDEIILTLRKMGVPSSYVERILLQKSSEQADAVG